MKKAHALRAKLGVVTFMERKTYIFRFRKLEIGQPTDRPDKWAACYRSKNDTEVALCLHESIKCRVGDLHLHDTPEAAQYELDCWAKGRHLREV